MVASSQCIQPECDFTGIQCTNAYYVPAEDECTKNFVTCTSGQLSSPIQVGTNMACLNGAAIPERNCQSIIDPFICHFTGIRCVGVDGMIWDDKETSHYILCNNGIVSQPIPVPSGSTCFNHQFILDNLVHCDAAVVGCQPGLYECVNQYGSVVKNSCTDYARTCKN